MTVSHFISKPVILEAPILLLALELSLGNGLQTNLILVEIEGKEGNSLLLSSMECQMQQIYNVWLQIGYVKN